MGRGKETTGRNRRPDETIWVGLSKVLSFQTIVVHVNHSFISRPTYNTAGAHHPQSPDTAHNAAYWTLRTFLPRAELNFESPTRLLPKFANSHSFFVDCSVPNTGTESPSGIYVWEPLREPPLGWHPRPICFEVEPESLVRRRLTWANWKRKKGGFRTNSSLTSPQNIFKVFFLSFHFSFCHHSFNDPGPTITTYVLWLSPSTVSYTQVKRTTGTTTRTQLQINIDESLEEETIIDGNCLLSRPSHSGLATDNTVAVDGLIGCDIAPLTNYNKRPEAISISPLSPATPVRAPPQKRSPCHWMVLSPLHSARIRRHSSHPPSAIHYGARDGGFTSPASVTTLRQQLSGLQALAGLLIQREHQLWSSSPPFSTINGDNISHSLNGRNRTHLRNHRTGAQSSKLAWSPFVTSHLSPRAWDSLKCTLELHFAECRVRPRYLIRGQADSGIGRPRKLATSHFISRLLLV